MVQAAKGTQIEDGFRMYTRGGGRDLEKPFEKEVLVPAEGNKDPAAHAWADARFCIDIMAEHGLFFALLMPPETAGEERREALRFHDTFTNLYGQLGTSPPAAGELKSFVRGVTEPIKPFIEYKARLGEAQT